MSFNAIAGAAAGLAYLSASLDEHMGHVKQNLASMGATSAHHVSKLGGRVVTQALNESNERILCASSSPMLRCNKLNHVPVALSSLSVDKAGVNLFSPGLRSSGTEAVFGEEGTPQEREENEHEDKRQAFEELIELQVTRTVVETSLMIQQEGICSDFLVAVAHDNPRFIKCSSVIFRQMTIVVRLDQKGQHISAHTAFFSLGAGGQGKTSNLPGQFFWGKYGYTSDWVALHWEKQRPSSEETLWKLQANAFQNGLTGVGVIIGKVPELYNDKAQMSFHIPGISHLWEADIPV